MTEEILGAALRAPSLNGASHAFFTRRGGVSQGVYASLNGGVGSRDATEAVAENRARMAAALGLAPDRLAVPYQVHSPDAVALSEHWAGDARPRCDGVVTATAGLALGVTGADCGMILFADPNARIVGAALLIDYGHSVTSLGDTLQALRVHRYVDPLAAPGDCDLTAHVDFAAMARSASATGAAVYGPIDQGDFLRAIGIDLRTKALVDRAGPERAEELQQARNRLVGKAKGEMGALFKAMAVANRKLPCPPGFNPSARPA